MWILMTADVPCHEMVKEKIRLRCVVDDRRGREIGSDGYS
jgi:hypothetical protein